MSHDTPSTTGLDPALICTLSDEGLGDRMAWIRTQILPHAIARGPCADGFAWEFEDDDMIAARLERLVTLERECCSGIVFEHGIRPESRRLFLEVRGIDPKAAVFESLQPPADATPRIGGRLAKAIAAGTALGLVVCCVLPLALAAVLGAAAAAPFATLDGPWIIAGAALLSGSAFHAWQGRQRSDPACGSGC